MDISRMSLRSLRNAIHSNEVSFPSQIPTFACQSRSDIQWRLVDLYFVRNWSCPQVAERYGITMERVRQIISNWVKRAIALGYVQEVPPLVKAPVAAAVSQPMGFHEVPGVLVTPTFQPFTKSVVASSGT